MLSISLFNNNLRHLLAKIKIIVIARDSDKSDNGNKKSDTEYENYTSKVSPKNLQIQRNFFIFYWKISFDFAVKLSEQINFL